MKRLLNKIIKLLFKKKIPKVSEPYVETYTECDKCYKRQECIAKGYLINCTTSDDMSQHYIKGRNCICVKGCEEFLEMKLSEILEIAETEDLKAFIRKAIDQLGDITYREFYQEGKFLEIIY